MTNINTSKTNSTHDTIFNLNDSQEKAVTTKSKQCIIYAGPGTGKTRVISLRTKYLIEKMNVKSSNIMALTFTKKAANEMRDRIINLCNKKDLHIGTFHAIAAKILRKHAERAGLKQNFVILNAAQQKETMSNILGEMNVDSETLTPSNAIEIISSAKNMSLTPTDFHNLTEGAQSLVSLYNLPSYFHKIYKEYTERVLAANAVDYDDLLLILLQLFKNNPKIKEQVSREIHHLLVDEFQDTNSLQYKLAIDLCSVHQNIFVVGDPQQTIFTWRHADVKNLDKLRLEFKEVLEINLTHSYRSKQVILDAAAHLMSSRALIGSDGGDKIVIKECANDEEEQKFIIHTIQDGIKKGRKYNDFAILARTKFMLSDMKKALDNVRIPYSEHLVDHNPTKEMQKIINYLTFIDNPMSNIINAILAEYPVSINIIEEATAEFLKKPSESRLSILDRIFGNKFNEQDFKRFRNLVNLLKTLHSRRNDPIDVLIDMIVRGLNLSSATEKSAKKIVHEIEEKNLRSFLDEVGLSDPLPTGTGVLIATLHASKGLEFHSVFITNCERGSIPFYRAKSREQQQEERRLLFVGMTRAKEMLYITHCALRTKRGEKVPHYRSDLIRKLLFDKPHLFTEINLPLPKHIRNIDTESEEATADDLKKYTQHVNDLSLVESQFIIDMHEPNDEEDGQNNVQWFDQSLDSTSTTPVFVSASSILADRSQSTPVFGSFKKASDVVLDISSPRSIPSPSVSTMPEIIDVDLFEDEEVVEVQPHEISAKRKRNEKWVKSKRSK